MIKKEALEKIAEFKKQGKYIIDLTFKSECVPYVKEEVSEIQLTPTDFHYDFRDDIVDYTKNIILEIGLLAGIEVFEISSQKLSKFSYIATATVHRKMPSMHTEQTSADYEFDAEVRFDIELANDIIKKKNKFNTKDTSMNDARKLKRIAEMAQHGRTRADTGAHKRAIIKLLQLPSPNIVIKGKAVMTSAVIFVSKIIPNLENSEMRQLCLSNMTGMANKIFITDNKKEALPPPQNDNHASVIKEKVNFKFEDAEIDKDADSGFISADYEIVIRDLFNSNIGQENVYLNTILDYILNNPALYEDAAMVVTAYNESDNKEEKVKYTIQMYLMHDAIKNYQEGKAVEYLNDVLMKGNYQKLLSSLKTCHNVVSKAGQK